MTSNTATYNATKPARVFVVGGCYAGLAAAIAILERCDIASPPIPVLITIVDERNGFCAVGIEMAAELKLWHPNTRVILAHSRDKLLSAEPLSDTFKERSIRILRESGVEVILNHRLSESKSIEEGNEVYFTNGERLTAGVIVMAISRSVPSTDFLPKEALDQDGYVNILPSQQFCGNVPNSAVHFAAGDMINWSGIKRCGSSMHMGKLVGWNVYQSIMRDLSRSIEEPKFKELGPVSPMITIAVGKKADPVGHEMILALENTVVWDYLRLGYKPGSVLTWKQSAVNILVYMFPEVRSIWTKLVRTENKKA
ncbi:hypothetical protein SCUP234_05972 [Seiridium cupressi]